MRYFLYPLLISIAILTATAAHAQTSCCDKLRQQGIESFNKGSYADAIKKWNAAKTCATKCKTNDLDAWIKKANDKLNPPKPVVKKTTPKLPTVKPKTKNPTGISAEDQNKREEAIRQEAAKKQREQADETAWKYTQRLHTKAAYDLYLDDYPSGKYSQPARDSIKALTPPVVTTPQRLPYEPEMIKVTGGTFIMGCKDGRDTNCESDEKPPHSVTLKDFYIGKYEVTQAQWRAVMGSDPPNLYFKGCDQCPVESVSWNDIQEFIKKLNDKTGKSYRLPTEAEWEYAARGGKQTNDYTYAGSNKIEDVAWYNNNANNQTHPVGQKGANELGIYDMSGNVWEWCSDWYGEYPPVGGTEGRLNNPTGPANGRYRVLRGGSWYFFDFLCRVSNRDSYHPDLRDSVIGFRLSRVL